MVFHCGKMVISLSVDISPMSTEDRIFQLSISKLSVLKVPG